MPQIAMRVQDSEASIGEKVFLFEVIGNVALALSDSKIDDSSESTEAQKMQKLHD